MIDGLRSGLVLQEATLSIVWRHALKRRAKLRVSRRVRGDTGAGDGVDYRTLRAGETRLVDGDLPQQVQSPRADISSFPQHVFR